MLAKTRIAKSNEQPLAMELAILKVPRWILFKSLIGKTVHITNKKEVLINRSPPLSHPRLEDLQRLCNLHIRPWSTLVCHAKWILTAFGNIFPF